MTSFATFRLVDSPAESAHRAASRELAAAFAPDVPTWERDGRLPPEVFTAIGARHLLRDRWALGEIDGLPLSVALLGELAVLSGGLGLAVSIHSDVFLAALHRTKAPEHIQLREAALDGDVIGCVSLTEHHGGSDPTAVRTTATRTGDGWHLAGEKWYTTNATCATHDLVLARIEGGGYGMFVVPLHQPGAEVMGVFPKLGTCAADTAAIALDVHLPPSALVGPEGGGLQLALHCLVVERFTVSAQMLAGARLALRLATQHLRTRLQHGEPLLAHQALRHRVADCWTELSASEALLRSTWDQLKTGRDRTEATAMLKLHAATTANHIADEAVQFFGGRGYVRNFPLERMWRDARIGRIGGGADEVMREVVGFGIDRDDPPIRRLLADLMAHDRPVPVGLEVAP